jgi:hypothetical protein
MPDSLPAILNPLSSLLGQTRSSVEPACILASLAAGDIYPLYFVMTLFTSLCFAIVFPSLAAISKLFDPLKPNLLWRAPTQI